MQHFLLHPDVLTSNRAVYNCGSGFNRNVAGRARSNSAIDYGESRPVLLNVFHYLPNEVSALKWETNMHNVTLRDRCGLIDVYTEGLISALQDLQQGLADLSQANNDNGWMHTVS